MSSSELAAGSGVVTDRTDEFLKRPEESRPDATSEPTPIGGGILVLGLLGAAGILAYARLVDPPIFSPFSAPVLLGSALVMVAAVVAAARKMKWRPSDLPAEAPWTVRLGWQSPGIKEDLYLRASSPWTAVLSAVPAAGIGGWAFYQMYWTNGETAGLIFSLVPASALIPGASALRRAWHRWTYGTSTLKMDEVPARLGQAFSAEVEAGLDPGRAGSRGSFQVSLTCYHRTKKSRAGKQGSRASAEASGAVAHLAEAGSGLMALREEGVAFYDTPGLPQASSSIEFGDPLVTFEQRGDHLFARTEDALYVVDVAQQALAGVVSTEGAGETVSGNLQGGVVPTNDGQGVFILTGDRVVQKYRVP